MDAVKDGSGLVRRRFVVRRDDDSCLRATLQSGDKIQGRRNGSWVADLAGTRIEIMLFRSVRRTRMSLVAQCLVDGIGRLGDWDPRRYCNFGWVLRT